MCTYMQCRATDLRRGRLDVVVVSCPHTAAAGRRQVLEQGVLLSTTHIRARCLNKQ